MRTALSLLGITIGIASIIIVSSIASSGRDMVFKELETFGLRTFWVYRVLNPDDLLENVANSTGIDTLDYKGLLARELALVEYLSPVVESSSQTIASKRGKIVIANLKGVSQYFKYINGDSLLSGRFLSRDDVLDRMNVAVVGSGIARKLFPLESNVIGQVFSLDDTWFSVVGVLQDKGRDLISSIGAGGGTDSKARILIPYTTHLKITGGGNSINYIQGQATNLHRTEEAIRSIVEVLGLRNKGAYSYKGESMSTYVETANKILGGVSIIGVVGAVVSLLVGGLAVMNIMMTSVIERTKEIGLRRAIGATRGAIRAQFLLEATLISLFGGLSGVLFGWAVVGAISALSALTVDIATEGVFLALVSTIFVGLASGYYPALIASRLEPVEALRHD